MAPASPRVHSRFLLRTVGQQGRSAAGGGMCGGGGGAGAIKAGSSFDGELSGRL